MWAWVHSCVDAHHTHTLHIHTIVDLSQHVWCMFNSTPWCDANAVQHKTGSNLLRVEKAMAVYLHWINPLLICQSRLAERDVTFCWWVELDNNHTCLCGLCSGCLEYPLEVDFLGQCHFACLILVFEKGKMDMLAKTGSKMTHLHLWE